MGISPGMTLEQLALVLKADISDAREKMREMVSDLDELQRKVESVSETTEREGGRLGTRLAGMATGIRGVLQNVGAAMTTVFVAAAIEAGRQEDILNRLRIAVINQGKSWENTRPMIEAWSQEMARAAGVTQDQVLGALSNATARGFDLAHSQDLITKAMKIARATGRDLNEVVGDLIGGYYGYTRQLIRLGLITREEAKNQDAFALAMKRVDERFTETSKAPLTVTKSLRTLASSFADLLSTIGKPLQEPLTAFITTLTSIVRKIDDFIGALNKTNPSIIRFAAFFAVLLGGQKSLVIFARLFEGIPILNRLALAASVAGTRFTGLFAAKLAGIPIIGRVLASLTTLLGPIGFIAVAVGVLYVAWKNNWFNIQERTREAVANIRTFLSNLKLYLADAIEALAKFAFRVSQTGSDVDIAAKNMLKYADSLRAAHREETVGRFRAGERELGIKPPKAATGEVDWTGAGGGAKAEDAIKKLVARLREAIETQEMLFQTGRVGIDRVIAAYLRLINNAVVPLNEKLKAELQLSATLRSHIEDRMDVTAKAIEKGNISYNAGVLGIRRLIDENKKFIKDKRDLAALEEAYTALIQREWTRRAEIARESASKSIDWIRRMIQAGTISEAELRAAFERIRQYILKTTKEGKERTALLEALAIQEKEITRQFVEDTKALFESNALAMADFALRMAQATASTMGDQFRVIELQANRAKMEQYRAAEELAEARRRYVRAEIADQQARAIMLADIERDLASQKLQIDKDIARQRAAAESELRASEARYLYELGVTSLDEYIGMLRQEREAVRKSLGERSALYRQYTMEISRWATQQVEDEIAKIREATGEDRQELLKRLRARLEFYEALAASDEAYAAAARRLRMEITEVEKAALTVMQQAAEATATGIREGIGEAVRGILKGTMTIGDAWNALLSRMLDRWVDMIAQMIDRWLASQLPNILSTVLGGGVPFIPSTTGPGMAPPVVPEFQTGGMVRPYRVPTGRDVVPAFLHVGEEVRTPTQQRAQTHLEVDRAGRDGPPVTFNITVQAIDTQSGTQFLLKNARTIGQAIRLGFRANSPLRREFSGRAW